MALEITDSNFEELVLKSDKPVLVDFWVKLKPKLIINPNANPPIIIFFLSIVI